MKIPVKISLIPSKWRRMSCFRIFWGRGWKENGKTRYFRNLKYFYGESTNVLNYLYWMLTFTDTIIIEWVWQSRNFLGKLVSFFNKHVALNFVKFLLKNHYYDIPLKNKTRVSLLDVLHIPCWEICLKSKLIRFIPCSDT
jgi:hypothetical protein